MLLLWLLMLAKDSDALARITKIFHEGDQSAFISLLERTERVRCDLRPLMLVRGNLAKSQVAECFRLWCSLFEVKQATRVNAQSDTNYAWLEVQIQLQLVERATAREYRAMIVLHFKAAQSHLALDCWQIQDLR